MLQENEKFEKAKAVLIDKTGKPTPHHQAYMYYQENWQNKRKAHQSAYAAALTSPLKMHQWAVEGKIFIDEINHAMNQWIALGYKNEIETALNILSAHSGTPSTAEEK